MILYAQLDYSDDTATVSLSVAALRLSPDVKCLTIVAESRMVPIRSTQSRSTPMERVEHFPACHVRDVPRLRDTGAAS